ncbi:TrkH family potassium uptake protein [bacterium]|nr:TrkH family potassium uptake protein [bacterium]
MNFFLVLNMTGTMLLLTSCFMIFPLLVSAIQKGSDLQAFLASFTTSIIAGLLLFFSTKKYLKREIKHREGFAIVTMTWLAMSLAGSLPYLFSGVTPTFTDAFFESIAGFTTTGSSVLTNLEDLPMGILLWRSLTQWMGGMGIIVFSLAILPMLGAGGMQLFKAEVPEIEVEKLKPRVIDMAKSLWYIYGGLTLILAGLLFVAGMGIFDAVCHALTTMATGGFSTKTASIAYFQSYYIDMIISAFMFMAGINFSLHFYALRGDFSRFTKSSEFKFYMGITLIAITAVTLNIMTADNLSLSEAFRYACFQVISIISTTGYATADYELWPALSQMLLIVLMFLGGMVGSTAGGMKQVRILLMLKQAYREMYHLIHPSAITALRLDKKHIEKETQGGIWGYLFLFILIMAAATIFMTALGLDLITAASTVLSSMSNVGPALGDAGPAENYSSLPDAGKWVLGLCMLMGRLEIYTVILLFTPMFWRK